MSEFNIEVEGGSSVRLPTGGKYCPKDIIVTAKGGGSAGGGDIDALIDRSITEVSSGVTSIGAYAFHFCQKLTNANIPNATIIGERAFQRCIKLASANFPNVESIGTYAFEANWEITSFDFPKATSLGTYAFYGCSKLISANIPNATNIANYLFQSCLKLESVKADSATSIGNYAFNGCHELLDVSAPNVTNIGQDTFVQCFKLEGLDTMAKSIGNRAFQYCCSLKSLILRADTVCTLQSTNAFQYCYHILGTVNSMWNPNGDKDGYIYVPANLVNAYKTATNWSTYASQIRAIDEGGGEEEGNWLFQDMMLDSNGNNSLPAPVVGTSYTCFVDGEEIATSIAESNWDGSAVLRFNTEDYRIYFIYDASTGLGWHFHPIDSQVQSGSVSIRINE